MTRLSTLSFFSGQPPMETNHLSLGDKVYETVLAELITLKVLPGSKISVDALARQLGVSQTPVRAALIRLEAEGLVVKTHNVGYSAADMPARKRFEEMHEMRLLLEPYMVALACERMSDEQRRYLSDLSNRIEISAKKHDSTAYGHFAKHDAEFHAWIAQQAGNELMAETLARLHAHMHVFRLCFRTSVTEQAREEHNLIISALVNGDAQTATDAMREHILKSWERMSTLLSDFN